MGPAASHRTDLAPLFTHQRPLQLSTSPHTEFWVSPERIHRASLYPVFLVECVEEIAPCPLQKEGLRRNSIVQSQHLDHIAMFPNTGEMQGKQRATSIALQ